MLRLAKNLMLFNLLKLYLMKQLRSRFTVKFHYLFIVHLCAHFLDFTNLRWRYVALEKLFYKRSFFMIKGLLREKSATNKLLVRKLIIMFVLRRRIKQNKIAVRGHKKVRLSKRGFSANSIKASNLLPYFVNFKKYAILAQMAVISSAMHMREVYFLIFGLNRSTSFKFFNFYIFSIKMLKILRKSQIFCIIKMTNTNVHFTISNGCGEAILTYSAGQAGFIKRKTRKKFSVFQKIVENLVFKLGNTLFKIERFSFVNIPKFMIYQIVAEFINRGICINRVWFYTKTSHSNFNKFKFKKLRRI